MSSSTGRTVYAILEVGFEAAEEPGEGWGANDATLGTFILLSSLFFFDFWVFTRRGMEFWPIGMRCTWRSQFGCFFWEVGYNQ